MNRLKKHDTLILALITLAAAALFIFLYWRSLIPIEAAEPQTSNPLESWDISQSDMNGAPLGEDKGLYELNTNIYDVYISIFPTKDANGNMLDFSAFDLHSSLNHTYNPTLNCNIQILEEGQALDPLLDLNNKNATIRVRGNSSRGDDYKSYKVKLEDEAGDFFGQKNLNINKHSQDLTKITTKLCTDLLADIDDVASYRTYFMRLWIRDASLPEDEQEFEYYGLYTELEQPNKSYLEARSLSSSGELYKARDFSFTLKDTIKDVDDPLYSREDFELTLGIREADNHKKLLEMLDAVNDTTRDFHDIFNTYFNEDNYLTWLAFNILTGNDDILNHNFLLYSPENSQTWYFIPWDFDGALDFNAFFMDNKVPESMMGIQRLMTGILHRRYFRMDGSLEKLDKKLQELLETTITRRRVAELIDSYKPVLEKTITLAPDIGLLELTPTETMEYIDELYDVILNNYQSFITAMKYPMPGFVSVPERYPDGSIRFAWDPFYSPHQRLITYNIRVYSDLNMQNLLFERTGLTQPECFMEDGLPDGIYYVLVSGIDSQGYEQISLEHVEGHSDGKFYYKYGLLEFTLK